MRALRQSSEGVKEEHKRLYKHFSMPCIVNIKHVLSQARPLHVTSILSRPSRSHSHTLPRPWDEANTVLSLQQPVVLAVVLLQHFRQPGLHCAWRESTIANVFMCTVVILSV